jgi:hypothetical protein
VKRTKLIKALSAVLAISMLMAGCGDNKSSGGSGFSGGGNGSVPQPSEENTANLVPIDGDDGIDVSGIKTKSYDSAFVAGDTAYEYYGFSKDVSTRYANCVKKANQVLGGSAQVYDIVIPTAMDVTLPDALRKEVKNTSDQKEATHFIYDAIGNDAKCIWILDTLRQHKKEYLYFRTDHHWTALGGYYAYKEFCKTKGITANALSSYEKVTFDGFLGSFYTHTKDENIAKNPDTVEAFVPHSTNDMKFTDKGGKETSWKIIKDVSSWNQGTKYNTFIGGDNPWSVIKNPKVTDGSSVLILKESFGNAMIPFLVDHYENIYIVDYRYYTGSISELYSKYKFNDVIFMSAISAGMGSGNLTKLESFLK